MDATLRNPSAAPAAGQPRQTVMRMLGAVALVHLLNDLIQSVLPAVYPMLKAGFSLSFTQVGLITLTFQCTASLLQPWVGLYTDRHPKPFLLPIGMCFTLAGIGLLAVVGNFPMLLLAAGLIGVGSSTFHPEASRVARMASGGRYGFAQSLFQVGGNVGSALGPLLAAAIVVGRGQGNIAWFMLFALLAIAVLCGVSRWYRTHLTLFSVK
jgi:FSR family fosmidomycin resistance protein-like MFS transporter